MPLDQGPTRRCEPPCAGWKCDLPITMHEPDDLNLMPWLGATFIAVGVVSFCLVVGFTIAFLTYYWK
jgi:hypothetical protein